MKENVKIQHYYNGTESVKVNVEIVDNRTGKIHCYKVPSYYVAENMFIEKYRHCDYKILMVENIEE